MIDDDIEMCKILEAYILNTKINDSVKVYCFSNVVEAINATNEKTPDLVFLDILLDGPDGFTLLNEFQSYGDLSKIPVVIVSSLTLPARNMNKYGIIGNLNKSLMTPIQVQEYVRTSAKNG